MSLYWTTECMPIGVTSLLPILLYPLMGKQKIRSLKFLKNDQSRLILGIMTSKAISRGYFQVI